MNKLPSNTLFFDIEAGGLDGQYSSVFSISYQTGDKKGNFYARPNPNSWVSRWSQEHVWEPIKGKTLTTEKEALQGFLNVLQANKGNTIAGWNIGVEAVGQIDSWKGDDFRGPRGFDIPMLITRADKYGMGEAYREAFSNVKIRDVGREYAYKIAKAVYPHRHLVDEELWRSVEQLTELGAVLESQGYTEVEAAAELAKDRYQLSGWKQEMVHNLLFDEGYAAHDSAADISAVRRIVEEGDPTKLNSPEFATKWNKAALKNTILSKLFKGPRDWENPAEIYPSLMKRANAFGLSDEIENSIVKEAAERGADLSRIKQGLGHQETFTKVGEKIFGGVGFGNSSLLKKGGTALLDIVKKNPIKAGIIAGLGFAYLTKPLNWFSGKDDSYNTIEGLQHRGVAGANRRFNTDFGSGYQGIVMSSGFLERHNDDKRISEKEWAELVRTTRFAQNQNIAIELITPQRARKALDEAIWWKNPGSINEIKAQITEREHLGAFGSYRPGEHVLSIGGLLDPNDLVAQGFTYTSQTKNSDFVGSLYSYILPEQSEATILHEGLHAVWDIELSDKEKQYFLDSAQKQLPDMSGDVEILANKSPVYRQVAEAYNSEPSYRNQVTNWIGNELFAHRGESLRYNTGYTFSEDKNLDQIVKSYINWSLPNKETIKPSVDEFDPRIALSENYGFFDYLLAHHKAPQTVLPVGMGVQFSGKDDVYNIIEGLQHKGIAGATRNENTDFGSGYKGDTKEDSSSPLIGIFTVGSGLTMLSGTYGHTRIAMGHWRGYMDVWHGTPLKNADSIRAEGLKPNTADWENILKTTGGNEPIALSPLEKAAYASIKEKSSRVFMSGEAWVSRAHAAQQFDKGLGPTSANMQKAGGVLGYYHPDVRGGQGDGVLFKLRVPMEKLSAQSGITAQLKAALGFSDSKANAMNLLQQTTSPAITPHFDVSAEGTLGKEYFTHEYEVKEGKVLWNSGKKLGANAIKASPRNVKATLGRLGLAAAPLALIAYGITKFSSKDDNYNTIEGLPHQGIAGSNRKENTDFGSGYQGKDKKEKEGYSGLKIGLGIGAGVLLGPSIALQSPGLFFKWRHMVTGRERLYHGTATNNVADIKINGLRSDKAAGERTLTQEAIGKFFSKDELKDLVYTTPNKMVAKTYALQSELLSTTKESLASIQNTVIQKSSNPSFIFSDDKGIVTFDIPTWKQEYSSRIRENPELLGTKNTLDWLKAKNERAREVFMKNDPNGLFVPPQGNANYAQDVLNFKLLQESRIFEGDLDSTYIKGSKQFKSFGLKEWSEYINSRPKEFAKGVGIGIAALSLAATVGYNLFSSKDDNYNTVEGLQHGGLAEASRHEHSDFGSGWVRTALSKGVSHEAIAKATVKLRGLEGQAADYMTARITSSLKSNTSAGTREIHQALGTHMGGEKWIFGKELGSGSYGRADIVFGASSRRTGVMKTFHKTPGQLDRTSGPLNPHLYEALKEGKSFDEIYNYQKRYLEEMANVAESKKFNSLEYEVFMQREARKELGDIVPEVYAAGSQGFVQELAGVAVKGTQAERAGAKWIQETWSDMLQKTSGVVHHDPGLSNIVRQGGRFRTIDYGAASYASIESLPGRYAAKNIMREWTNKILRTPPPKTIKPVKTPAISPIKTKTVTKTNIEQLHREAQRSLSINGQRPGRGHTKQTGTIITNTPIL